MSSNTLTLFDIPTREGEICWSMNTWRTRLLLNYKGLNYETEWLEYPDIKQRLEGHVPPNEKGAPFTVPAIRIPDGFYLMDSYKIVEYIEEKYPEPKLPLNTPVQFQLRDSMVKFMTELTPVYVPGVAKSILGDKSLDFFNTTREDDLGMPLDKYAEKHSHGAFERAEPFAHEITMLLNETTSGPFFLGDTVSYADFIWGGILLFFTHLRDEDYHRVLKSTGDAGAHTKFLDALRPWLKPGYEYHGRP